MVSLIRSIATMRADRYRSTLPVPAEDTRIVTVPAAPRVHGIIRPVTTELPTDFLTSAVERQDTIPQAPRIGVEPTEGFLHASTLVDICARQQVIATLHKSELLKPVTSADRVVWRLGRAAEKHVRNQFIADKNMRDVYGKWTCRCPLKSWRTGFFDDKATCPRCRATLDKYAEVTLYDRERRVHGNPDMLFRNTGKYFVTEVKSINGDEFAELKLAKAVHVWQAIIYRHLLSLAGFPVSNTVIVFYVNKHYSFKKKKRDDGSVERSNVYKEFHIDATAQMYVDELARMLALAEEVRDHVNAGMIPTRTVCDSATCARAKTCPIVGTCFNL